MSNDADSEIVSCEWLEISFNLGCELVLCIFQRTTAESACGLSKNAHIHTNELQATVRAGEVSALLNSSKAQRLCVTRLLTSLNPDFSLKSENYV